MTTITVEIEKDQDLPALEAALSKLGLKYHIEEGEDWGDLSEAEIEGIKEGLDDIEAGRVHSREEVMADITQQLEEFRRKNGK